jgi:hypothetical protein
VKVKVFVLVLVTYTRTVLVIRPKMVGGVLGSGRRCGGNRGVHFPGEDSGCSCAGNACGRESRVAVRDGRGGSSYYG